MTYPALIAPFAIATIAIVLATARLPGFAGRAAGSAITAAVLVVLTAVFDNAMIAAGLFSYPAGHLSGLRVGLAPVEDFSYAVCAAFLLPALHALVTRRRDAKVHR